MLSCQIFLRINFHLGASPDPLQVLQTMSDSPSPPHSGQSLGSPNQSLPNPLPSQSEQSPVNFPSPPQLSQSPEDKQEEKKLPQATGLGKI